MEFYDAMKMEPEQVAEPEQILRKCDDNLTRRGRIRGKLKRRVWIRDNDIVIIAPWDLCARVGALTATYCLEHVGPQGHRYSIAEFVERFRKVDTSAVE